MFFGGLGAAISGAINAAQAAGAISSANKNNNNSSSSSSSSSSGTSSNPYNNRYPSGSSSSGSSSSSSWGSSSSSTSNTPKFDANTDYQALINQAVSKGDYQSAAQYEQLRNQKIDAGYGNGNDKTNNYSQFLNANSNSNWSGLYQNTDWSQMFQDSMGTASVGQLQNILNQRLNKLNGKADAWQEQAQSYVDGLYNQMYQPQFDAIKQYEDAMNGYMDQYEQMQDAIKAQNQAAIEQNVSQLEAQKTGVYQAGQSANSAAQQNYMNLLNPNGSNAEMLAALGLSNSGLSESSAIAAQNAYTNAVNSNEQNVSNQIQAIELAIKNAQLSGDLATAEQLQGHYNTVLQAGMQNANNILSAMQWAISNGQSMNQQNINNAFTQAGITGSLNGKPTMAGEQLSYTIEGLSLDNQIKQFQLLLQQAYGMKQAEAEYQAQLLANSGASLENAYQELYNRYFLWI